MIDRVEDNIIAKTWALFVEEDVDDPNINLLLPMTKVRWLKYYGYQR